MAVLAWCLHCVLVDLSSELLRVLALQRRISQQHCLAQNLGRQCQGPQADLGDMHDLPLLRDSAKAQQDW